MARMSGVLVVLLCLLFLPGRARAIDFGAQQTPGLEVSNPEVTYTFGGKLVIHAEVSLTAGNSADAVPIQNLVVFLQSKGSQHTLQGKATLQKGSDPGKWVVSYTHDLTRQSLRAFSDVTYWFGAVLQDGAIRTSPLFSFYYEDNRYAWQTLEAKPFEMYWYEGNLQFAQEVFNTAWDGLTRAQAILPLSPPGKVRIYAYASAGEAQSSLQIGGMDWAAGHTDPDLGVIAISLPPGADQRLEMARQIPHELMHVLLYNRVGEAYKNLPVWYVEGLASMVELYPDANYPTLLETARKRESLIPMDALCRSFPKDASGAVLAYAQATSFMQYLQRQYGTSGLERLLGSYMDGMECERGVEVALGASLAQLEQRWQRAIFDSKPGAAENMERLFPWWVLLAALLLTPLIVGIHSIYAQQEG